jgi:hypothetical protein
MWQSLRGLWHRLFRRPEKGKVPKSVVERRQWPRFSSKKETLCRPAHPPGETNVRAGVRNISQGGINLLVPRSFSKGTLLHVDSPEDNTSHELLACVVQVTLPAEHSWAVGCSFLRALSEPELQAFL